MKVSNNTAFSSFWFWPLLISNLRSVPGSLPLNRTRQGFLSHWSMTCDHVWGPADARGQHKGPVVQSDGTRQGSNTQITGSEGRPWISTPLILLFSTCLWYDKLKPPPWRSWHYCISVQNINSTWQLRGCRLKRGILTYVSDKNPNLKKSPKLIIHRGDITNKQN